jgi:hypothetical protein
VWLDGEQPVYDPLQINFAIDTLAVMDVVRHHANFIGQLSPSS